MTVELYEEAFPQLREMYQSLYPEPSDPEAYIQMLLNSPEPGVEPEPELTFEGDYLSPSNSQRSGPCVLLNKWRPPFAIPPPPPPSAILRDCSPWMIF